MQKNKNILKRNVFIFFAQSKLEALEQYLIAYDKN